MAHWERPLGVSIVWSPFRITPIYWLMARMPSSTFLHRHAYTGECAICSSDFSTLMKWPYQPFCSVFSGPIFGLFFAELLHLHFGNCNCGTMFSSRWSAWIFVTASHRVLASIASDDPHSKRVNFMFGVFLTRAVRFTMPLNVYSVQVLSFLVALRKRPRVQMLSSRQWIRGLTFHMIVML